jgi:hypothetical protein
MSRPALISKLRRITDANALETVAPSSGPYGPE